MTIVMPNKKLSHHSNDRVWKSNSRTGNMTKTKNLNDYDKILGSPCKRDIDSYPVSIQS